MPGDGPGTWRPATASMDPLPRGAGYEGYRGKSNSPLEAGLGKRSRRKPHWASPARPEAGLGPGRQRTVAGCSWSGLRPPVPPALASVRSTPFRFISLTPSALSAHLPSWAGRAVVGGAGAPLTRQTRAPRGLGDSHTRARGSVTCSSQPPACHAVKIGHRFYVSLF